MEDARIVKSLVRFIVPFSMDMGKAEAFASICKRIEDVHVNETQTLWASYNISDSECDLYDTVQRSMNDIEDSNREIGRAYRIHPNCKQKLLPKLQFNLRDSKVAADKAIDIAINNMGLYVFHTGIGFIWYELKTATSSMNELLQVNNKLKELAYKGQKDQLIQITANNEDSGYTMADVIDGIPENEAEADYIKIPGKSPKYLHKGKLPADILQHESLTLYQRQDAIWYKYEERVEFSFYTFIQEYLSILPIDTYFATRIKEVDGKKTAIPDKALLYSVALLEESKGEEVLPYLYWLGKGYVDSYLFPDKYFNEPEDYTFAPFENSRWYANMEGCAQVITKTGKERTDSFFDTIYWSRIESYFLIYIIVLHQYYCLLRLDYGISQLPNDIKGYDDGAARRKLNAYREKLNFFFMNSVFLKVSHLSHHNEYFDYLKQVFGLENITSTMLEKITIMDDMVERWRENKKGKNILAFTIIGSIFAFIQTLNNALGIYDFISVEQWVSREEFGLYSILASVLVGIVIWIVARKFLKD